MKIILFILGLVISVAGLGITVYGWYVAHTQGRIFDGLSYSGPFLLIVGLWRVLSSATAARPPAIFRMVAVLIGFAAGFGNTAALKATFPGDQIISTHATH